MDLKHFNYVALMNDGRLKIGRTTNVRRRMRQLGGVYHCEPGRPVTRVVARFVESNIRQVFAGQTIPGTYEWFAQADKATLCVFAEMTERMQGELEAVLQ